jgi:hypothetical protein
MKCHHFQASTFNETFATLAWLKLPKQGTAKMKTHHGFNQ